MITIDRDLAIVILIAMVSYILWDIFRKIILPKIINHGMKELDRNPKWVTSQLQYYGFNDIDIVLCESKYGMLPRFRYNAKKQKIELWVPNDISTRDVENIGQVALVGKIKVKYGLFFPDKPLYWLSILCYMLDGGDVKQAAVKWEENKKPLD